MAAEFIKSKRIWRVVMVATEDGVLRSEACSYSRGEEYAKPYNCSKLPVTQVDAKTYRAEGINGVRTIQSLERQKVNFDLYEEKSMANLPSHLRAAKFAGRLGFAISTGT